MDVPSRLQLYFSLVLQNPLYSHHNNAEVPHVYTPSTMMETFVILWYLSWPEKIHKVVNMHDSYFEIYHVVWPYKIIMIWYSTAYIFERHDRLNTAEYLNHCIGHMESTYVHTCHINFVKSNWFAKAHIHGWSNCDCLNKDLTCLHTNWNSFYCLDL